MLIAHISDSHIELPAAEDSDRCRRSPAQRRAHQRARPPTRSGRAHRRCHPLRQTGGVCRERAILDGLRAPFCVIPGNRDDRVELRKAFESRLPDNCHSEFVQYAIVNEGLCAIMLDSVSTQSNKARLCETRLSHFSALLDEAGDRPVVVFMHHPPFEVTESAYPVQFEDWSEVDALAEHRFAAPKRAACLLRAQSPGREGKDRRYRRVDDPEHGDRPAHGPAGSHGRGLAGLPICRGITRPFRVERFRSAGRRLTCTVRRC